MKKKFKNYLSFPFNSNLVFKVTESLLNKSPGGYILSFHDLSPEVFSSQVESLKPAIPVSLNELIDRHKSGKSIKNCFEDFTLPPPNGYEFIGGLHPLTIIRLEIISIFEKIGFNILYGPEIESD